MGRGHLARALYRREAEWRERERQLALFDAGDDGPAAAAAAAAGFDYQFDPDEDDADDEPAGGGDVAEALEKAGRYLDGGGDVGYGDEDTPRG